MESSFSPLIQSSVQIDDKLQFSNSDISLGISYNLKYQNEKYGINHVIVSKGLGEVIG